MTRKSAGISPSSGDLASGAHPKASRICLWQKSPAHGDLRGTKERALGFEKSAQYRNLVELLLFPIEIAPPEALYNAVM